MWRFAVSKGVFTNYITQVSKQVVFCLKFYLTLITKTPVFYRETRIDR